MGMTCRAIQINGHEIKHVFRTIQLYSITPEPFANRVCWEVLRGFVLFSNKQRLTWLIPPGLGQSETKVIEHAVLLAKFRPFWYSRYYTSPRTGSTLTVCFDGKCMARTNGRQDADNTGAGSQFRELVSWCEIEKPQRYVGQ